MTSISLPNERMHIPLEQIEKYIKLRKEEDEEMAALLEKLRNRTLYQSQVENMSLRLILKMHKSLKLILTENKIIESDSKLGVATEFIKF